jgi:hypothetical protein
VLNDRPDQIVARDFVLAEEFVRSLVGMLHKALER